VDGNAGSVGSVMRDGVELAVKFEAPVVTFELIAEEAEERDDPEVARLGAGGGVGGECVELALKDAPVVLGVGPGAGDFVLHDRAGGQAEVGWALTGEVFNVCEQFRRDNCAF
jgi:hypothetical protein